MYKQNFALVSMTLEVVVPHHLIELSGAELMGDLIGAVAQGEISAELKILVASPDVGLEQVPEIIARFWQARLTASTAEMSAAKAAVDVAETDELGRIKGGFLWWQDGTPLVDVQQWFRGARK